jgi:hypothetical protein
MGLVSRDVTVNHDGHEIALSVTLIGSSFSSGRYRLYIDGQLADEQSIPALSYFVGGAVTLRAQLPSDNKQSKPRRVKVVANLRLIRNNDYLFFVEEDQIHQEWATYGGM